MVATRRGVRVYSPSKTNRDQSSDVQATPTGDRRRTRSTAKKAESPTQHASVETCNHEKVEGELPATSSFKRCTGASRLHSPEQPSTPVDSTHEADISDAESCCSARSDIKPALTGTRRRQPRVSQEDDSEVESCSTAVSASRVGRSTRRSVRRTILESSDAPQIEAGDAQVDLEVEPEPRSSVTSESQRVTRSQRKTVCTRSSAKQQTDSELSDTDSYLSGLSGPAASKSTSRRVARSRKQSGPIPIHLDDISEGSRSPATTSRRSRAARGKAAAATVDASDSQSCDSDGFESGPTCGLSNLRRGKSRALDSDSDLSNVHSPMSSPYFTRSRGTSCAGSGISSRGASPSRCVTILEKAEEPAEEDSSLNDSRLESTIMAVDADCTLLEEDESQTLEGKEEEGESITDPPSNEADVIREEREVNATSEDHPPTSDSQLDDESQTLEGEEGVSITDPPSNEADVIREEKEVNAIPEDHPPTSDMQLDVSACATDVSEAAVSVTHQQEELSDQNESDEKTSEMEVMQETIRSPEPPQTCQSVTLTLCERSPETTEETGEQGEETGEQGEETGEQGEETGEQGEETGEQGEETGEQGGVTAAADDTQPSQRDGAVEEGAVEQTLPEDQEKMEVTSSDSEAQQVVNSSEEQIESIQITSSQQHVITVDSGPTQQPADVTVQKTRKISLLSSEDEEEEEEDEEEEEEEGEFDEEEGEMDFGHMVEDGQGSSNKSEAAGTSIDGLFMIDTRPGQDADDQYYMEKLTEEEVKGEKASEEQQDEEFVDEDGDEDDDEDAGVLFSTRNSLVKEMSSRIDPGIKVKDLGGLYINFDGSKSKPVSSSQQKRKEKIQDEVMKKSVIGPDFEKKDVVPPYTESKQALKLKHRVEREKSTGNGWFNMKAPEITPELKGELQVLKMRGSLDPKRFYKKNDRDGFPKFFQVGTVVDNPVDFYHSRVPKKDRKRTMVDELLADAEFRHNNKKKYQQIIADKAAKGAGKRNKKNKVHKK